MNLQDFIKSYFNLNLPPHKSDTEQNKTIDYSVLKNDIIFNSLKNIEEFKNFKISIVESDFYNVVDLNKYNISTGLLMQKAYKYSSPPLEERLKDVEEIIIYSITLTSTDGDFVNNVTVMLRGEFKKSDDFYVFEEIKQKEILINEGAKNKKVQLIKETHKSPEGDFIIYKTQVDDDIVAHSYGSNLKKAIEFFEDYIKKPEENYKSEVIREEFI
jgi:hypothetical protein